MATLSLPALRVCACVPMLLPPATLASCSSGSGAPFPRPPFLAFPETDPCSLPLGSQVASNSHSQRAGSKSLQSPHVHRAIPSFRKHGVSPVHQAPL